MSNKEELIRLRSMIEQLEKRKKGVNASSDSRYYRGELKYFCEKCRRKLSEDQIQAYSCPYCGYDQYGEIPVDPPVLEDSLDS